MTEEDAWGKWCPFAASRTIQTGAPQIVTTIHFVVNGEEVPRTTCLTSACMAWRWRNSDLKHGDCGLAGK
jgi:hypothetical protein